VVNLVLTASSHGFIAAVITIPPGRRDRLNQSGLNRENVPIGSRAAPAGNDLGLIGRIGARDPSAHRTTFCPKKRHWTHVRYH
jgi:hypothetical protein